MVNELNQVYFISTNACITAPHIYGLGDKNKSYGDKIYTTFTESIRQEGVEDGFIPATLIRVGKIKEIASEIYNKLGGREVVYYYFRSKENNSFYSEYIPNLLIDRVVEPDFKPPRTSEEFKLSLTATAYWNNPTIMKEIQTVQKKDLSPLIIPSDECTIDDLVDIFRDPMFGGISSNLKYRHKFNDISTQSQWKGTEEISEESKGILNKLNNCLFEKCVYYTANGHLDAKAIAKSSLDKYLARFNSEKQFLDTLNAFTAIMNFEKKRAEKGERGLSDHELCDALSTHILLAGGVFDYGGATINLMVRRNNDGRYKF